MNNENNVPQVNGNVPAQKDNSGKNNGRQPRARGELKAEFAHVLAFLNSCTLYQADAVRVMVSHATGNGKYEEIASKPVPEPRHEQNQHPDGRRCDTVPCRTVGSPS